MPPAAAQAADWLTYEQMMHALIAERLRARFYASPAVGSRLAAMEHAVAAGRIPVMAAALELLGERQGA